jgi:hypothetical protein
MMERGPAWIGHKHRGGAVVRYLVGLDVSLEETAICIVDEAGGFVREARVTSEPDALVVFFEALGMALERVGLEACSLSAWLHRELSEAGYPGRLHRDSPREGREGCDAEQDRSQGCVWYRADHAHWMVSHCAREKPVLPLVACFADARRMVLNKRRDVENGVPCVVA